MLKLSFLPQYVFQNADAQLSAWLGLTAYTQLSYMQHTFSNKKGPHLQKMNTKGKINPQMQKQKRVRRKSAPRCNSSKLLSATKRWEKR